MSDEQFAEELKAWWSFNNHQQPTHGWHARNEFIEKILPILLRKVRQNEAIDAIQSLE